MADNNEVIIISDDSDEEEPKDDNRCYSYDSTHLYNCYHCNRKFLRYRELNRHIRETPLEELEVSLANYTSRNVENYDDASEISGTRLKSKRIIYASVTFYHCPKCTYSSRKANQLNHHIISAHTNYRPVECSMCQYKCITSSQLKMHIMAKHTNEKPHKCTECYYQSVRAASLKKHVQTCHFAKKQA